jgi:hypothetical protein
MAASLNSLETRRFRNVAIFIAAATAVVVAAHELDVRLSGSRHFTGWALVALMLPVALYGGKKKLPFLPLGTSAAWLQFHLYAGLGTVLLFAMHVGLRVPHGPLETILYVLFALVAGSGILGIALSRLLPARLRARGEPILYARLPVLRRELRERAEALVLGSEAGTASPAVAEFYHYRLRRFFAAPRNFVGHLAGSPFMLPNLLDETDAVMRYLDAKERAGVEELKSLVKQKDHLDRHHALQGTLRAWLFVHVPLTWALLIFAATHVALVQSFAGGR